MAPRSDAGSDSSAHHSRQKVEGGARRPTGTEDCQSHLCAARRPDGAAGKDSHGRVRGCPGAVGAAGEAVDYSSLRYLTAALRQREEEERLKELEEAKERADEMKSLLCRVLSGHRHSCAGSRSSPLGRPTLGPP